jgi:prevent-host-death family protein
MGSRRPCSRKQAAKLHSILRTQESLMAFTAADVVPLTDARARLSELADEAKAGAEKIITKNGESYVALIDAARLDYYHRLERERIHLLLLEDARRGLEDVIAGRTRDAREALAERQRDRERARLQEAASRG